jgi:HTH-type transcriptional regulator / antitoxin HigA
MDRELRPIQLEAVAHPGETVMDYLAFHDWSQRDLARRAGLTPKTISEICNGKAPISPTTALSFEKVFQRPAHFWLNLQRLFEESVARRYELSRLAEWDEWGRAFPIKEMRRLNFSMPTGRSDTDILLNFFGVSSPESWDSVWRAAGVAYRQTRKFKTKEQSVAAWVREAELVAREFELREFDEQRLRSSLGDLRRLTRYRADEIMDPVQKLCAASGVAVVWVPELRNTGISGCARWLSETKALIALTIRYKTDDQMWFTIFHELGHILLHRNKRSFIIDNAAEDLSDHIVDPEMQQYEEEANRFAADTLIPPRALTEFIQKRSLTNESIKDFAEQLEIGPGILVGRLQHDGILERHQGNAFKQYLGATLVDES